MDLTTIPEEYHDTLADFEKKSFNYEKLHYPSTWGNVYSADKQNVAPIHTFATYHQNMQMNGQLKNVSSI
eukprot:3195916-Ditylum_brightwellii.AAC.1